MSEDTFERFPFDEKLITDNIRHIDYIEYNTFYIECDRCGHDLKNVHFIEIDDDEYCIGNDCYDSIKRILSKLWGLSIHWVRDKIEGRIVRKTNDPKDSSKVGKSKVSKFDPEYSIWLQLRYDYEKGYLPSKKISEYKRLKKKFKNL